MRLVVGVPVVVHAKHCPQGAGAEVLVEGLVRGFEIDSDTRFVAAKVVEPRAKLMLPLLAIAYLASMSVAESNTKGNGLATSPEQPIEIGAERKTKVNQ